MISMSNYPTFKPNFKYSNLGNCVGMLTYAKELLKRDTQQPYGHEFLIFAKGQGSINVRIPKLEKSQAALANFPIDPANKPNVRIGLTSLSQFVTEQGKVYTQLTSFLDMEEAKKVTGEPAEPTIKGRFGGEVFNIQDNGQIIRFHIISFPTDKDGKLQTGANGTPYEASVVQFEIHDPNIANQFRQGVQQGANLEVGYKYINQDDVTYDEYGMPSGSGQRVERVEVGRLNIHSPGGGNNVPGSFGNGSNPQSFGNQQQQQQPPSFGNQQQQNGFNPNQQQQQQQNQFNPNQQQQYDFNSSPFANQGEVLDQNDPLAQQANNLFGNGQQGSQFNNNLGNGGFPFANN